MYFSKIFKSLNRIEKRIFVAAAIIFMVALTLWGIAYFYSRTVEVPVSGGTYVEGLVGQPTFINSVIAGDNEIDSDLSKIIFSDLITLSEQHKVSDDGRTWNVFLKSDLKWSDGEPLTSDDVIFTIDSIQDIDSRSPLYQTWQGVVVQRISELEIEFSLKNSYSFFFDNLKDLRIIPKHIYAPIPAANFRISNYNLEPVGSGPYKFSSYDKRKDGFITEYFLVQNENYAGDKALIKNIDFKFFSNTTELIKAFNTKKIDGFGDLNSRNINDLKMVNQLIEIRMPRYYAVFFNPVSQTILKDKNVRQALNLATDKNEIIEKIFNNKAVTLNQPLTPEMNGYDFSLDQPASIEKSIELLEKAGWALNQASSTREKIEGKNTLSLNFEMIVPQIPFLIETAEIIKADWKKIGVNLELIILEPTDINEKIIKTRNYQMLLFGNILKENPDIFAFWHSSEKFYPGLNLALYENKTVDTILESIRKNPNEETRAENIKNLQTIFADETPAIFLYSPTYLYVAPKNLGGFDEKIISSPSERFNSINKWHLKTTRVFK